MNEPALTFAEIHRRFSVIPDGPAAILNTPGWLNVFIAIGTAGIALGLAPSVMILWMQPQAWMAQVARAGLVIAILGYALPFARSILVFVITVGHWKRDQAEQLDHDLGHIRALIGWIASHPPQRITELLDYTRQRRVAITERLALLGGVEKLGLLPILVGFALHVRAVVETARIHPWEGLLGVLLVLIYAITFIATLMRERLGMYERILERAVASREPK
jgi:hypothetical protein